MTSLSQKIGDGEEIWFSGRIDTKTRLISCNFGRIKQQTESNDISRGDV